MVPWVTGPQRGENSTIVLSIRTEKQRKVLAVNSFQYFTVITRSPQASKATIWLYYSLLRPPVSPSQLQFLTCMFSKHCKLRTQQHGLRAVSFKVFWLCFLPFLCLIKFHSDCLWVPGPPYCSLVMLFDKFLVFAFTECGQGGQPRSRA